MFSALERAWSCASTLWVLCNGCPEDIYGGTASWTTIFLAALVNSRSNYRLIIFLQIQALRYLRQVAHEDTHSVITGWGRQPAALRALSQKLTRLSFFTGTPDFWWFLSWIFFTNGCTFFSPLFQRFQWSSQWACWWWMVCDWKWWSWWCLYLS